LGKAKIWYINEDVNFLEMIHGSTPMIRLIRKDKNEFYGVSDIKFLIIPFEIFQVLYLQALEINNLNFIRDSGKRFGIIISTTYKMYSGIERVLNEDYLKEIIKLTEKKGPLYYPVRLGLKLPQERQIKDEEYRGLVRATIEKVGTAERFLSVLANMVRIPRWSS